MEETKSDSEVQSSENVTEGQNRERRKTPVVRRFAETSSMEPASYFTSSHSPFEIGYWAIITLVLAIFTIVQIVFVIIEFRSLPTGIEVEPVIGAELHLPNSTVCVPLVPKAILAGMRWSKAQQQLNRLLQETPCDNLFHPDCDWFEQNRSEHDCINRWNWYLPKYTGTMNTTINGKPCLNWMSNASGIYNEYKKEVHQKRFGTGDHNYCRETDNGYTWCHVAGSGRWDYCIKACSSDDRGNDMARVLLATAAELLIQLRLKDRAECFKPLGDCPYGLKLKDEDEWDIKIKKKMIAQLLQHLSGNTTHGKTDFLTFLARMSKELCKAIRLDVQYTANNLVEKENRVYIVYSACEDWIEKNWVKMDVKQEHIPWACFVLPTEQFKFSNEIHDLFIAVSPGVLYPGPGWKDLSKNYLYYGRTAVVFELREKLSGWISSNGIRLQPGKRTNLLIEKTTTFTLFPPKNGCEQRKDVVWGPSIECLEWAQSEALRSHCNLSHCIPATSFSAYGQNQQRPCSWKDYQHQNVCTSGKHAEQVGEAKKSLVRENCKVNCIQNKYKIIKSEEYATNSWNNYTSWDLYFSESSFMQMTEKPLMSPSSLFAELGGTLGLYLGLSIIPFFHLFYFLLEEVFKRFPVTKKIAGRYPSVKKAFDKPQ